MRIWIGLGFLLARPGRHQMRQTYTTVVNARAKTSPPPGRRDGNHHQTARSSISATYTTTITRNGWHQLSADGNTASSDGD